MFNKKKEILDQLKSYYGYSKTDDFNFDLISIYSKQLKEQNTRQYLSDKTCEDLNFEALFKKIDRTSSKIGQQYLYSKLRRLPEYYINNNDFENHIQLFSDNENLRLETQYNLHQLNKTDAYYIANLFQNKLLNPPKWLFLMKLLSFFSLASLILIPFEPRSFFIFLILMIINLFIHYWNKKNLFTYFDSLPQLLKMVSAAKNILSINEIQKSFPNLGKAIDSIWKLRRRMSVFTVESKLSGDLEVILWGIIELIKIAFLIEPLALFSVLKHVNNQKDDIHKIFQFIGYIDSAISVASLRKGVKNYCLPTFIKDKKYIKAEQIFHPLISACVSNTFILNNRSMLLTGSNMSGKTSFIRTIGVNAITAYTLNTCFAKEMVLPKMNIYSAIRINDDLLNDKSYYFEEVSTIKNMIKKSESETMNLFLLDEIFKGTNTIERVASGKAVLSYLNNNNNFIFVSTHDIELTDYLKEEYELFHFSEIVIKNNIDFDYKIKRGPLKNRNAIRILKLSGYPDKIINEAEKLSKSIDKKKT